MEQGDREHGQGRGRRRESPDSRAGLEKPEGHDTPEQETADQWQGSRLESFRGAGGAARGAVAIGQDLRPERPEREREGDLEVPHRTARSSMRRRRLAPRCRAW